MQQGNVEVCWARISNTMGDMDWVALATGVRQNHLMRA
jgi:hypothetical protein